MRAKYVFIPVLLVATFGAAVIATSPNHRDRLFSNCVPARMERDCLGFKKGTVYGTECRQLFDNGAIVSNIRVDAIPGKESLAAAMMQCSDPAPANELALRHQNSR